jgi:hypothetical protein
MCTPSVHVGYLLYCHTVKLARQDGPCVAGAGAGAGAGVGTDGLHARARLVACRSACWQVSEADLPRYSPRWSCGLRFRGAVECRGQQQQEEEAGGSSTSSTSTTSRSGTASSAMSASAGQPATARAYSGSSGMLGGPIAVVVDADRSGPGSSSASGASISCDEEDASALLMPVGDRKEG